MTESSEFTVTGDTAVKLSQDYLIANELTTEVHLADENEVNELGYKIAIIKRSLLHADTQRTVSQSATELAFKESTTQIFEIANFM
jgi:hypothetical protein